MIQWFLPIALFFSVSVRSPNVQPNPFDYELSLGMEKTDLLYINRQWERELGKYYIDDEYWAARQFGNLYLREKFYNKTSHRMKYNQADIRYKKAGFSAGYALRHLGNAYIPAHRLILGYEYDNRLNIILLSLQLTARMELTTNFNKYEISAYNKAGLGLLQNLSLYLLARYETVQTRKDWQAKIGLEMQIPQIKSKGGNYEP